MWYTLLTYCAQKFQLQLIGTFNVFLKLNFSQTVYSRKQQNLFSPEWFWFGEMVAVSDQMKVLL